MKRSLFILMVVALLASLLGGCAQTPGAQEPQETPRRVVYLINGALGDQSFLRQRSGCIDKLPGFGVETRTLETNFDAAQYEPALQAASSSPTSSRDFLWLRGSAEGIRDRYPKSCEPRHRCPERWNTSLG